MTSKRSWYHRNKDRAQAGNRRRHLASKYGITEADYEEMVEAQGNRCAVCFSDTVGGRYDRWHIDHDHATGKVRGLLCTNCNRGIGHFKDNPLFLASAIEYLNGH